MEKNGRLKRTIKIFSQFENKKPEELESKFDHFDAAKFVPLKGCNIVDLDFVYKDHLMGINLATPNYLTQYQRERLIGLTSILYL